MNIQIGSFLGLIILLGSPSKNLIAQNPHVHIQQDNEAVRLDGNAAYLSFYEGGIANGFLQNYYGIYSWAPLLLILPVNYNLHKQCKKDGHQQGW